MSKLVINLFIFLIIFVTVIALHNKSDTNSEDTTDGDYSSDENTDDLSDQIERLDVEEGSGDEEEEEDEEDYDEGANGQDECTALEVVKNMNISDFLPDDFEELKKEKMIRIVDHFDDTWGRFQRAFRWEHKVIYNKNVQELMKYLYSMAYEFTYEIELDYECMGALTKFLQALFREEIWAFKFLDSQAHPLPTGFWGGVISSFGEYDQCLDIKKPEDDGVSVHGQYCMLKLIMPYPLTENYQESFEDNVFAHQVRNFTEKYGFGKYAEVNPMLKLTEYLNMRKGKFFEFGICIPDKCKPKDIEKEVNKIIYPLLRIPVEISESSCSTKDEPVNLDAFQKFAIVIFSTLTALVLLSTGYELYERKTDKKNNKNLNKILLSFSIISNTNKLFEENTRFASVNTIKLLIAIQFIAAHTYFFTAHSFVLKRFNDSVPLQLFFENRYFFVRAKQLGVDSLMVASGLLLSYHLIGILEKSSGKFNYVNFVIRRWLKLSVPLFAAILLYYLLPLIGSGPIWHECDDYFQPGCKDWQIILSNFLYFSNFNILTGKYFFGICVHTTWFLSANFQLCLIAPALIIALYKWPKFGLRFNIMLILSGIILIISPYLLFHMNTYYEITRLYSLKSLTFSIFAYHMNTLQYICSFAIGLLAGYAVKNNSQLYIPAIRYETIYGFLTSISLMILPLVLMWNNSLNIFNDSPSELNAILFFGLGKFLWSAALGWIWYACCTGREEKLNKILSVKWIQPMAKLYYLIYLVHFPVIFFRIYSIRQTYIMTDFKTLENIYIDFTLTLVLAYILHIIMVSPIENIIKYFSFDDCMSGDNTSDARLSQVISDRKKISTAQIILNQCITNGENKCKDNTKL